MQVRRRRPSDRKCSPWKKVSRPLASARLFYSREVNQNPKLNHRIDTGGLIFDPLPCLQVHVHVRRRGMLNIPGTIELSVSRWQPLLISCVALFVLLHTFDYRHCQPNHDSARHVLRGLLHVHILLFRTTDVWLSHWHRPVEGLLLFVFPVLFSQHRLLRDSLGSFRSLIALPTNKQTSKKLSSTSPAVKEKEDLHPDVESQEMNDDTFCEYR